MGQATLMAIGDVIFDLDNHRRSFDHVKHVLRQGDVVVANCDQTCSDLGESPNGFWPIFVGAPPHAAAMIDTLIDAGVSVASFANNHCLDWGYDAQFDCIEKCRTKGLVPVGFGENIEAARRPAILERSGVRFGFLAYCCIGPAGYEATRVRPGHAPMRIHTHYDHWDPQPGTPPLIRTFAHKEDLADMIADVAALRDKVDVVVCYFHWGVHYLPELIADYQFEVGHAVIDAGADIVFGVHAHLPKGIEIYKGKAIFHGMHNFACRGEWVPPAMQPGSKFPDSHQWDWTEYGAKFKKRFGAVPPEILRNAMIVKATVEGGRIVRVSFVPCWIDDDRDPVALTRKDPRAQGVLDYFEKISRSQGLDTVFRWDGDEVVVAA